ncbi:MAG: hypothetical protein ABH817_00420 [archaeon]
MKKVILFILICVILLPLTQAKIIIQATDNVYSLGESITQKISIISNKELTGNFEVYLECDQSEELVYFSPVSLQKDREHRVEFTLIFTEPNICQFKAVLGEEIAKSNIFLVSEVLEIELELDKVYYDPAEKIKISGEVLKSNGKKFNGEGIITLAEKEYPIPISNGKISYSLYLSDNISQGNQSLDFFASDENGNYGEKSISISVSQIATSLNLNINPEKVNPGETITIGSIIRDQGGELLDGNISIKIINEKDFLWSELPFKQKNIVFEELILSGSETVFEIPTNFQAKDYVITAYAMGFREEKILTIPQHQLIEINIEEEVLIVKNIGNVPYTDPLTITFDKDGELEEKIFDLNLEVGQTQKIKLDAPEGIYDVIVGSLKKEFDFPGIPFFGEVIGAVSLEKSNKVNVLDYVWLVLIILGCGLIVFYFLKKGKIHKKRKAPEIVSVKKETPETHAETKPEVKHDPYWKV